MNTLELEIVPDINKKIQYVTCLFDLKSKTTGDTDYRDMNKYLEHGRLLLTKNPDIDLIIYTEKKLAEMMKAIDVFRRHTIIGIDLEDVEWWAEFHDAFKDKITLTQQHNAGKGNEYKKFFEYRLLTCCKFYFIKLVLDTYDREHVGWVDFGLCHGKDVMKLPMHLGTDKFRLLYLSPTHLLLHNHVRTIFTIVSFAGGLMTASKETWTNMITHFKAAVYVALNHNFAPLEEQALSFVYKQHPELFSMYIGHYSDVINNYYCLKSGYYGINLQLKAEYPFFQHQIEYIRDKVLRNTLIGHTDLRYEVLDRLNKTTDYYNKLNHKLSDGIYNVVVSDNIVVKSLNLNNFRGKQIYNQLRSPRELERYKSAILNSSNSFGVLNKHIVPGLTVEDNGTYTSPRIIGLDFWSLYQDESNYLCDERYKVVKAIDEFLENLDKYDGRFYGDWAYHNFIWDKETGNLVNIDLEGFYSMNPAPASMGPIRIKQWLNMVKLKFLYADILPVTGYGKQYGKSYNGNKFTNGYHSFCVNGQTIFTGQRDIQRRYIDFNLNFSNLRVLDVGTNQGAMLLNIANQIEHGVGVDYNRKLINVANKSKQLTDVTNVDFYVVNLEEDPLSYIQALLPQDRVDVCLYLSMCMWLTKWKDIMKWISEHSTIMFLETNGTDQQQIDQVVEATQLFKIVFQLNNSSIDDPSQQKRKLYICIQSDNEKVYERGLETCLANSHLMRQNMLRWRLNRYWEPIMLLADRILSSDMPWQERDKIHIYDEIFVAAWYSDRKDVCRRVRDRMQTTKLEVLTPSELQHIQGNLAYLGK